MVVTKREILVSIIMGCLMLCLGLWIDSKIIEHQTLSKEKYNKTLKISNDNDMFKYAIDTNVGNILVYGKFKVDKGVTDEWLKNDYMYIKKITEEYRRHTRVVCSGSKKSRRCHTETYHSWDEIDSQISNVPIVNFSGIDFDFHSFKNYQIYRLELKKDIIINEQVNNIRNNCIYEKIRTFGANVGDKRYYYKVINKKFKATVFGTTKDNKFVDRDKLNINEGDIKEFLINKNDNFDIGRIFFWILYIVLCGVGIVYYVNKDNNYLEDRRQVNETNRFNK